MEGIEEISFGVWEGLTYNQIGERYPLDLKRWQLAPNLYGPPKGENLKDLKRRVMRALNNIIKESRGKDILIAAHGGVNRVLLATLSGIPLSKAWAISQSNTALNIFNHYGDGRVILDLINSTSHLQQGGLK